MVRAAALSHSPLPRPIAKTRSSYVETSQLFTQLIQLRGSLSARRVQMRTSLAVFLKPASCSDFQLWRCANLCLAGFLGFAVQPFISRLNNMRVGLERATSCHDHDGFQASPRQLSRTAF